MKLRLDVTPPTRSIYQVSKWYLKTCRKKSLESFVKSNTGKNNRQNSEHKNFEKKLMSRGIQPDPMYQIWIIYVDSWGHDCKKNVWPTLGCKLGQMTQLWWNSISTCRATNWMYIPSFKLISQSMLKKSPGKRGRPDGRNDGRTDIDTA